MLAEETLVNNGGTLDRAMTGATVSTVQAELFTVVLLVALSVAVTVKIYVPSASCASVDEATVASFRK